MKLFQDLPNFALENILSRLSFVDKANVFRASVNNANFNSRLKSICKYKRPKFCPFCILFVGTAYSEDSANRYIQDMHNQMLNSNSGDIKYEWTKNKNIYSIKSAHNRLRKKVQS